MRTQPFEAGSALPLLVTLSMLAACGTPADETPADASAAETETTTHQLKSHQVGEIQMRVAEQGEGPLVLLLHGFPESWYSWRYQLPAVAAAGYRAVAPDMRGYGGTDAPEAIEDYDMEHLCADVAGLVDAYGEERAVLVGHDWGAGVAWNCMTLHSDRFRAVAALSVPTGPRGDLPFIEALESAYGDNFFYMLYFQEPGVAEAELDPDPRQVLQRIYASPDTPREPPEITDPKASAGGWLGRIGKPTELPAWLSEEDLDYYVSQFEERGFRGGLNYYRNFDRNWHLTADVEPMIAAPALFIAGEQDGVIRGRTKEQLEAAMGQVVSDLRGVHLLPGAGHWVQQERAEEVNRLLIELLNGL